MSTPTGRLRSIMARLLDAYIRERTHPECPPDEQFIGWMPGGWSVGPERFPTWEDAARSILERAGIDEPVPGRPKSETRASERPPG